MVIFFKENFKMYISLYHTLCQGQSHLYEHQINQATTVLICGLPRCRIGKESACQCRRHRRYGFDPWRRKWLPISVFLPGESHGQKSLVGYSPQACKKQDMTKATQHGKIYFRHQVKISWTEKSGELQSVGSQRVGCD